MNGLAEREKCHLQTEGSERPAITAGAARARAMLS